MTTDNTDILRRVLGQEKSLSSQALDELRSKYPFFTLPDVIEMRQNLHGLTEQERSAAIDRLAATLPTPADVERVSTPEGDRFDDFYPRERTVETPTTNQAIDRFLLNYGGTEAETEAEASVLERLIFNPVADYSQQLAREEEQSLPSAAPTGDSRTDRLNRFILANRGGGATPPAEPEEVPIEPAAAAPAPPAAPHRRQPEPEPPQDALLSESLAKIFIKTRRYDRAYEIISHLSLAIPEKNAYFADQLRFLRKLMLNEQVKQQKSATN